MSDEDVKKPDRGFSRRDFMKISGITLSVPLVTPTIVNAAGQDVRVYGPSKAPITLNINGKRINVEVEPRVTLLDALRDHLDLTGAKRVCDRGACGACTVLLDGKAVYACSILAIDAQSHQITTIEGLSTADKLHPVMQSYVEHDAQQCGFCTPGFVVATKAFLDRHPNPKPEDLVHGLSGNFCRCGTYAGIREVALTAAAPVADTKKGA
jgi:xanthine dehydrogenase YagT iron-sulfur-binding subunit